MGWIPPREGGPLVHGVNHQWLIALGFEERLLPASIVKQFAADRAKAILVERGTQGRAKGNARHPRSDGDRADAEGRFRADASPTAGLTQ